MASLRATDAQCRLIRRLKAEAFVHRASVGYSLDHPETMRRYEACAAIESLLKLKQQGWKPKL